MFISVYPAGGGRDSSGRRQVHVRRGASGAVHRDRQPAGPGLRRADHLTRRPPAFRLEAGERLQRLARFENKNIFKLIFIPDEKQFMLD